jgi:laminin beta 1
VFKLKSISNYFSQIALIPKIDALPIFIDTPRGEEAKALFQDLDCSSYFLGVPHPDVPKNCSDLLNSISYFTFDGGLNKPCECDNTGSESTLCDKYTGECPCKRNVVGRRCDRCAPGTYGFGADGCKRK